jgi:hypothetical protein
MRKNETNIFNIGEAIVKGLAIFEIVSLAVGVIVAIFSLVFCIFAPKTNK